MGTMGNQQTKDAPAAPNHTTEYGTLGIIELKKTLMEQSDRLGEGTDENLARTPSR